MLVTVAKCALYTCRFFLLGERECLPSSDVHNFLLHKGVALHKDVTYNRENSHVYTFNAFPRLKNEGVSSRYKPRYITMIDTCFARITKEKVVPIFNDTIVIT